MIISNSVISNTNTNFKSHYLQHQASRTYKELGMDFIEITQKQGVNKGTIVELLKRMILSPKFEERSLESICSELLEKIKPILEAVNSGKSSEELQKLFRFPEKTVNGLLVKQERLNRAKEAVKLFNQGFSMKEIGQKMGFERETIRLYLQSQGVVLEDVYAIRQEKIIKMVKDGYCDEEIAMILGIARNSVLNARRKHQLKPNRKKGKVQAITPELVQQLESGVKRRELAKEHGICKEMVDKLARTFGIYRKNVAKRDAKAMEMLNNGVSAKEIAKSLDISYTTVLRIIHKNKPQI